MRTTNLNLMMQKGSRVVQMIIAHIYKFSYFLHVEKMRSKNVQWNSVYYQDKSLSVLISVLIPVFLYNALMWSIFEAIKPEAVTKTDYTPGRRRGEKLLSKFFHMNIH